MSLSKAQKKALKSIRSGNNDCEATASVTTRVLRAKGLLDFAEVDGRTVYVLTDAGRRELER